MDKPIIVRKSPEMVELEEGKNYAYCACGSAKNNNPFCDGSHKITELRPKIFKVEQSKKAAICMCRHSANTPFCDGTHAKL